jgi:hypothetical protein
MVVRPMPWKILVDLVSSIISVSVPPDLRFHSLPAAFPSVTCDVRCEEPHPVARSHLD